MLATDPLALPHIAALCAALDEGDDSALLPLADALEEMGDPRAVGLRAVSYGPVMDPNDGHYWFSCAPDFEERTFPSRHAAMLALAEALCD